MKPKSFIFAVMVGLTLGAFWALSVDAHPNRSGVVTITAQQFDPALSAQVASAAGPVVIEFYDPSDPDTSGECARQLADFQSAQQRYAGRVTFVRANVQDQDQNMIQAARIAVCPTHLFVLENDGQTLVAKRIWGYLSESQFEELLEEFWGVKP